LRGRLIESDKGFSVELLDRNGMIYSEKKKHGLRRRRAFIDSEQLADGAPYFMWISKSSIRRWGKYGFGRVMSEEEKDEVINNVQELFYSQGLKVIVA
jgi:hypothetical protein